MNLVLHIAWTHVRTRVRQSLVGMLGIAMGVGFSVMMAALMEGSQRDFVTQLVDSLPHITLSDDRRSPPRQPAEAQYDAVEISGLSTAALRPGIKNPYAIMAALESWVPGAVAPSVQAKAVIRYASRDTAASVTGIDPRREVDVSKLATQIRQGSLDNLYKASNAIVIGDKLAARIGARVGNTIALVSGTGRLVSCTVVGLLHSGISQTDETQAYTLIRTAQILAGQTGLVNAIRIRARDVMAAREIARRVEAETGYKAVSWQEANEDLLSAFQIRNFIMYAVVGAILLVASFGTYNIISTITHEKTRDIAILKSLGFTSATVRRIFLVEALLIGTAGCILGWALGYALCLLLGTVEFKSPFMDATRLPLHYTPMHYALAAAVAMAASAIAAYLPARKAAGMHPVEIIRGGIVMAADTGTPPIIELRKVTRRLEEEVPTTLVRDIDLVIQRGEFVAITGPSGSGKSSLLYLLGLLDVPSEGEIVIDGRPTDQLTEDERARLRLELIGFVFQFHFLLPEFSALDNVMLPMRALALRTEEERREAAMSLLSSLGLAEHAMKRPGQMSGGQRQRVAIARALANEPLLILADEPTGNLDSKSSEQVLQIFRKLVDETGTSIAIVTHDMALAARTDRRVDIVDGRIARADAG